MEGALLGVNAVGREKRCEANGSTRSRRRLGSVHDVDAMTSPALDCNLRLIDVFEEVELIASGKRCAFTMIGVHVVDTVGPPSASIVTCGLVDVFEEVAITVISEKRRSRSLWGWRVHVGFEEAAPVHVVDTMGPPSASIVTCGCLMYSKKWRSRRFRGNGDHDVFGVGAFTMASRKQRPFTMSIRWGHPALRL